MAEVSKFEEVVFKLAEQGRDLSLNDLFMIKEAIASMAIENEE